MTERRKMAEKTEEIDRWEERKWKDGSWYENDTDWGIERFDLEEKKNRKVSVISEKI